MWGTRKPWNDDQSPEVHRRQESFFTDCVQIFEPQVIVEFGSWEGASAVAWASELRERGIPGHIYCVDTWLGSVEHWENAVPSSEWSFNRLRVVHGEPLLFETFCNTVWSNDFETVISPVRASTKHATPYLVGHGIAASLVYVDAGHSLSEVYRDLLLADVRVDSDGAIAGDDWPLRGLKMAVIAFATKFRRAIFLSPEYNRFIILRPEQRKFQSDLISRGYVRVSKLSEIFQVCRSLRRYR